ncbi:hypothetical protein E6C50_11850 [Flavobacterium supellecticarium]|uniref:DUF4136 domain-containing protein n=1 Tax=Flavobacterium supellecticarium TaxID=2565924 RepID=A0A4S3ZUI0_9FLAO|nr:hypothetical protein [Flavobacterium supellecticarium]THF49437.1 hypothetical protein E6C50_11850 [Flavobacterium supellecticarium]
MRHRLTYIFFLLSAILINMTSCNFAPGSYPYAEEYDIDTSEKLLITAIENFKKHHPEFNIPNAVTIKGNPTILEGGRGGVDDYWYHIYFYYPDSNQIIYSWTRPINDTKTSFAFVSINQGLEIGNWKEINHDLKGKENSSEKEKFERLILDGVKKELSYLKSTHNN